MTVTYNYSEATFKRIAEDALFFRRKAAEDNIDDSERKRYSRIVILLMAFYLESLSNLLFDKLVTKDLEYVDNRTDLPKPIRRFRAVHNELHGKELALCTDGIQDIFTIRNRVIAHPAGRSEERSGKVVRTRVDKTVSYKKFTDFPFTYSQFTVSHADEVLEEVKYFLLHFFDLLKGKVSPELLDECWPKELIELSKEAPKHKD